jgi:hypothetical protein
VFANLGTTAIVALDQATGEELWRRTLPRTPTEGVDIQPTVYADLVFASTVPVSLSGTYVGGDRGVLHGLDPATGASSWTFDTVDSETSGAIPTVNSGGGSWYSPAIDTERGRILWGVANPAPFPGTPEFPNGSSRPGPNLYTDSLVALDVRSGALEWYRQAQSHDIFDHDLIHALLVEVGRGAAQRTIAVATGKGGRVLAHDRDTGELLWSTPVGIHQNDELTELSGPTPVMPGTFGGVITPPAAAGRRRVRRDPERAHDALAQRDRLHRLRLRHDARTGGRHRRRERRNPLGCRGRRRPVRRCDGGERPGPHATFQGAIIALDRATGREVWRYAAPGGGERLACGRRRHHLLADRPRPAAALAGASSALLLRRAGRRPRRAAGGEATEARVFRHVAVIARAAGSSRGMRSGCGLCDL